MTLVRAHTARTAVAAVRTAVDEPLAVAWLALYPSYHLRAADHKALRALAKAHTVPKVQALLAWYRVASLDDYCPLVLTPQQLLDKWPRLAALQVATVVVGPVAQALAAKLAGYNWQVAPAALAQGVARSLAAYHQWLAAYWALLAGGGAGQFRGLMDYVYARMTNAEQFVEDWYVGLAGRKRGPWCPIAAAWHPRHQMYMGWGAQLAGEYCGQPERWSEVVAQVTGLAGAGGSN